MKKIAKSNKPDNFIVPDVVKEILADTLPVFEHDQIDTRFLDRQHIKEVWEILEEEGFTRDQYALFIGAIIEVCKSKSHDARPTPDARETVMNNLKKAKRAATKGRAFLKALDDMSLVDYEPDLKIQNLLLSLDGREVWEGRFPWKDDRKPIFDDPYSDEMEAWNFAPSFTQIIEEAVKKLEDLSRFDKVQPRYDGAMSSILATRKKSDKSTPVRIFWTGLTDKKGWGYIVLESRYDKSAINTLTMPEIVLTARIKEAIVKTLNAIFYYSDDNADDAKLFDPQDIDNGLRIFFNSASKKETN